MLKNLFDPIMMEDTKRRVLCLRPEAKRQWGSLEVGQMLAHCTAGMEMARGALHARRAPFPARLIGALIKPLVFRDDKPIRRNSPSSPDLFPAKPAERDFMSERSRLIAALEDFAKQGPAGCSRDPHPFFGPLRPEEWAILAYKHIDHHLRQFGV